LQPGCYSTAGRWTADGVARYTVAGFVAAATVSGVTIELDGLLWKPAPGAAVTAEEFLAARSLIGEIHQSLWWNPWVLTDRAADDAA
jgi:hypothetical protein